MATVLQQLLKSKTVGYFAGIALLFNQMTGPGVPFTSTNFQSPGWLPTSISYILFCFISGFSILFLIQSMQSIPGNAHFQGEIEYSTLINFYFGRIPHLIGQFVLYAALQSNAMQSLVLTAQSVDSLLIDSAGHSCGVTIGLKWICASAHSSNFASPFGDTVMLCTFGFLISIILAVPLGFTGLENSISVTLISAIISMGITIQWLIAALLTLEGSRVPAYISPFDISYGQVMGTVMLNLACSVVIPSWINIKSKEVAAHKVIWTSMIFTSAFYIGIGLFLALGFDINESKNVLDSVVRYGKPQILSKVTVGLFAIVMLLPVLTKHQLNLLYRIHSNSHRIKTYLELKSTETDSGEYELTWRSHSPPVIILPTPEPIPATSKTDAMINKLSTMDNDTIVQIRRIYSTAPSVNGVVAYIDPSETGRLANILERNIPDVEIENPQESPSNVKFTANLHIHGDVVASQIWNDGPRSFETVNVKSDTAEAAKYDTHLLPPEAMLPRISTHSLPTDPGFITPPFRCMPKWITIEERTLANIVMYLAILFSLGNIILNATIK